MIKTIFRLVPCLPSALLIISAGGCSFEIFEEVNPDPHPPSILNFQYSPTAIETGGAVIGTFGYIDAGGDIEELLMRDLSGTQGLEPTPPPEPKFDDEGNPILDEEGNPEFEIPSVFFFPGTTGTILWQLVIETNQAGPHTIQVWLEDSEGSRSEPVFFEVAVSP